MEPILPTPNNSFFFRPTFASTGSLPCQRTVPTRDFYSITICNSSDPISAPNCPPPTHTVQAPSQSMSKGRLRQQVSARFPRVTLLQGKKLVNHASIYPQPSASVRSKQQQWKCYLKGVPCPDTLRLTKPLFSIHFVTTYM